MDKYIEKIAATTIPLMPREHRTYQTLNLDDAYEDGWYDAIRCVENIPPSDVRPVVRGKWIKVEDYTGVSAFGYHEKMVSGFKCSACEFDVDVSEEHFNFCPNCGADMRGGIENDEKRK